MSNVLRQPRVLMAAALLPASFVVAACSASSAPTPDVPTPDTHTSAPSKPVSKAEQRRLERAGIARMNMGYRAADIIVKQICDQVAAADRAEVALNNDGGHKFWDVTAEVGDRAIARASYWDHAGKVDPKQCLGGSIGGVKITSYSDSSKRDQAFVDKVTKPEAVIGVEENYDSGYSFIVQKIGPESSVLPDVLANVLKDGQDELGQAYNPSAYSTQDLIDLQTTTTYVRKAMYL